MKKLYTPITLAKYSSNIFDQGITAHTIRKAIRDGLIEAEIIRSKKREDFVIYSEKNPVFFECESWLEFKLRKQKENA